MCQAEIPRQGILLPRQLADALLFTTPYSGDTWLGRDVRFVVEYVPEIKVDCADVAVDALVTTGVALMIQA